MQFNDRVYGTITIDDPCAIALIESPAFDRLWRIKQNGPFSVADPRWTTSRAEHCIGTYHLLRTFGASREEQLAGLVHDANHLAFSHLIDWLLNDTLEEEAHHEWITVNPHLMEIRRIIIAQGLDAETILDYSQHPLLEQPSPALCADRIDYTFRDGLCAEQISKDNVHSFLNVLRSHHGRFVMTDVGTAERFSHLSINLHIIRESNWGNGIYLTICRILRRAMNEGSLEKEDFLVDDIHIYKKMHALREAQLFFAWENAGAPLAAGTPEDHDLATRCKIRVIDPDVLTDGVVQQASELRSGLASLIAHYRQLRNNTLHMKYPEEFAALAKL